VRALASDVAFAIRLLLRRPGFTALAVLTLAVGTGASTAVFSLVDHVLLRPLPFPSAARLLALCETNPSLEGFCVASPPNAQDWARESRTLASIGQGRSWPFMLRGEGASEGIRGGLATPGLFGTLGVRPALGRLLEPADEAAGERHVAVLSDAFWRSHYGADRAVLTRSLVLDGERYRVVGVLPADVEVPTLGGVHVWVPMPFDPRDEENRRWRGFLTIGRLADGASAEAAADELRVLQRRLAERHPDTNRGYDGAVRPLLDVVVGSAKTTLPVFLGAVAILLLVACVNVANLLVARGAGRQRELAVRAALGARPWAIARMLSVESVLLALAGGATGIVVATWGADALLALMPDGLPRVHAVGLDPRIALFGLVVTLATGLLAGALPALQASRVDLAEAIKAGHQPVAFRRALGVRGGLVSLEVAMAFVLAVGAGLLTRSYAGFLRWEPGFDRTHLLTFWTYASTDRYPDAARVAALFARVEESMRALPGVTAAGMTSSGPLFGGEENGEFVPDGAADGTATMSARWYDMSPSFFPTLGVRLKSGRLLADADRAGAPRVALVNEAFARRWFPGTDVVGRRIRERNLPEAMQIVGVVADVPSLVPGAKVQPEIYWPYQQSPRWASYVVLRTTGDPAELARAVEARLAEVDPDLRPAQVETMEQRVDGELARPRFQMLLIGVFAALAVGLTAVGVYGVIAASVAGRTREIGIRVALGAGRGRVVREVVREGMMLAGAGLAAGGFAAFALARFAASLLHGVAPTDPATYAVIGVLIAVIAAAACLVPARRAARVDPMEALRAD
jgi:predicted permease